MSCPRSSASQADGAPARPRRPAPGSTSGLCRARLADGAGRASAPRPRRRRHRAAVRAAPGPDGPCRAHRRAPGRRLHGARHHRPQHRRQDGRAAHGGPAVLMHQAGLHVPGRRPAARLPIFRDVFADIGDEQSVAQSLSTFSGHLRSIVRIVEAAGEGMPRAARRAGCRHRPDRGLRPRPGAPGPLHPCRRARGRDDALRGAQDLRPQRHRRRATPRSSSTSSHAQPDVPPVHRPAGHQPGVRDRGTPGAAAGARGGCSLPA